MTAVTVLGRSGRHARKAASLVNVSMLGRRIDKISTPGTSLEGAGIFFIDAKYNIVKLRDFSAQCRRSPIYLVLKEPETPKSELLYAAELSTHGRESKLVLEASTTLVTCTAAALTWIAAIGATTAAPITAGTSTAVTYLATGAAIATTLQCANGLFRTNREIVSPESLDALDSNAWYTHMSHALDVISIGGAGAAAYGTIKAAQTIKASTGKSYWEALSGLNRQERKRLTEEVIRRNHPGVSNQLLKSMVRSGQYPVRYTTQQVNQAFRVNIKNSVSASLSFSSSAISGVLRNIAVGVYEVMD